MLRLHTIKGDEVVVNGQNIERLRGGEQECHILLTNGSTFTVTETVDEIVDLHREDRARVAELTLRLMEKDEDGGEDDEPVPPSLRLVDADGESEGV